MVDRFEIVFSAQAADDLEQLFVSIEQHASTRIAANYISRLERFCHGLQTFLQRGTEVRGSVAGLRTVGFERRVTILFQINCRTRRAFGRRILQVPTTAAPWLRRLLGRESA